MEILEIQLEKRIRVSGLGIPDSPSMGEMRVVEVKIFEKGREI